MGNRKQSAMTFLLNVVGRISAFAATYLAVFWLWKWRPAVALLAGIPIYMLVLGLLKSLTAPLYRLTPEDRVIREAFQALQDGDYMRSRALADQLPETPPVDFEGLFPRDEDAYAVDQEHEEEPLVLTAASSDSHHRHF